MGDQPSEGTTVWTDEDAPRSMREFGLLTHEMIATIPQQRWQYVERAVNLYKEGDWYGADLIWLYVRPWVPEAVVHRVATARLQAFIHATSTSQAESSSEASGHEGPASVVAEVPENPLVRASDGEDADHCTTGEVPCN